MAEEVKLFGVWASPYSCRIEVALQMKGVQYEVIEEDLSNKSELLLKYNPVHKKIPVLLHNGNPICESLVILEYIDETWKGTPLLPVDPYDRAMTRFWAKFMDEKCMPALWKACWSRGKEQEAAMEEGCELLKTLEKELKNKRFFGGDSIGLVDIVANYIGFWVGVVQDVNGVEFLTEEKFPTFCKWITEYVNCIIIKSNLPPRDQLFALFKAHLQAA